MLKPYDVEKLLDELRFGWICRPRVHEKERKGPTHLPKVRTRNEKTKQNMKGDFWTK